MRECHLLACDLVEIPYSTYSLAQGLLNPMKLCRRSEKTFSLLVAFVAVYYALPQRVFSHLELVMPTKRWMYIAPISLLSVGAEWMIMFGFHWTAIWGLAKSAPEELTGKFYVLFALMVGQAGLWGYLGSLSGEWVWQIWSSCKNASSLKQLPWHYRGAILTRFAFVWVAVGGWYYIVRRFQPVWDLGPYQGHINIRDAGVLGFVLGGLGASAMWVVEIAVYSSRPADHNHKVNKQQLNCYLQLRQYLGNFLTVTGIVLTLGTLSLNASRDFIKTASEHNFFPRDLIAIFGGVFTVLLGMAYAPAYLALRTFGSDVRDSIVPGVLPSDTKAEEKDGGVELIEKWAENRDKLDDLLQLQIRDWKSFGPQFAILAPLATGLASRLIGGR